MKITEVEIDKIKADTNQPRQSRNEENLKELAQSIVTAGIIYPIEIDKNFVIITGERRWRAAKIAGLKVVPVRILDISDDDRFIRQAIENIHQEKMSPLDTAMMLDKIRKKILSSAAEVKKGHGGFRHGQPGVRELHKLLGMPESTISEYLALLGETKEMKEALNDPEFSKAKVPLVKEAPEKYRRGFRKLIVEQKTIPRDIVSELAKALRRADRYGETYNAEKLLKQNYEGLSSVEASNRINRIVLDENERVKEPANAVKLVSEKIVELMDSLDKHPLTSLDNFHRPFMIRDIQGFVAYLQNYLNGNPQVKRIGTEQVVLPSSKKV